MDYEKRFYINSKEAARYESAGSREVQDYEIDDVMLSFRYDCCTRAINGELEAEIDFDLDSFVSQEECGDEKYRPTKKQLESIELGLIQAIA